MKGRSRMATKKRNRKIPLKAIELFSGAGGLALATHSAGFENVAMVEWNHDACQTLRKNASRRALPGIRSWNVLEADIRDIAFEELGNIDVVAGGPPCQPFSIGGKHRGKNDSRDMIPQFIRAVRELAPKAFILENVKGLTRQAFRSYFEYTVLQLTYPEVARKKNEDIEGHLDRLESIHTQGRYSDLQYNVVFRVLNAADYGVPQTRQRVFIVGFREDLGYEWHFPEPTSSLDALLWDQWITGDYWKRHHVRRPAEPPKRLAGKVAKLRKADPPVERPWRSLRDAIGDLPNPQANRECVSFLNHKLQPGARSYPGHTGSPVDLPSKTLKAGVHGVPGGENTVLFPDGSLRYLTVREAARVQTFPDRWLFSGAWSEAMRQLGNAVPVELAAAVSGSVRERLGG